MDEDIFYPFSTVDEIYSIYFDIERKKLAKIVDKSRRRQMKVSEWILEAVDEKLERESVAQKLEEAQLQIIDNN